MESMSLLTICISAMISVFFLLSLLAVVMRLILAIFPQLEVKTDSTIIAAVVAAAQRLYPGTTVTKVEEVK
ncbi:MAG: hypothetical protein JSV44_01500 [Candidatus Zixiibacteriota bacterium]|nr:MAG: hypothetical protein JSV44_01500 [candidate division Zixibacteria bacterium]